jgi:hypothetical protein
VFTSCPNYEDWGWFLEYLVKDDSYWICCGNLTGTENQWQILVEPLAKGAVVKKGSHWQDSLYFQDTG